MCTFISHSSVNIPLLCICLLYMCLACVFACASCILCLCVCVFILQIPFCNGVRCTSFELIIPALLNESHPLFQCGFKSLLMQLNDFVWFSVERLVAIGKAELIILIHIMKTESEWRDLFKSLSYIAYIYCFHLSIKIFKSKISYLQTLKLWKTFYMFHYFVMGMLG